MLRLYKPLEADAIEELHSLVEHLVNHVWCEADENDCLSKLKDKFVILVETYDWLKSDVLEIYEECKPLTSDERQAIKDAFRINNCIEDLCNGVLEPVHLSDLPEVVEKKMKSIFVKFYEDLLNKAKVGGDKLEYYKALYRKNKFRFCPCCGYVAFETGQTDVREAYDHYLPKALYPFASVNFKNLVPLCYKCNSDRKKAKDPIKDKQKAYYPFRSKELDATISINISTGFIKSMYENFVNNLDDEDEIQPQISDFKIDIISATEAEQVLTWNRLFDIKGRFSDRTGQFSFSVIKEMWLRHRVRKRDNASASFESTIDSNIDIFNSNIYGDENYLKVPFLNAVKNYDSIMNLYK